MVSLSDVGAGLAVGALVVTLGVVQFRFNAAAAGNGTCATESIEGLEDLGASNRQMTGLGAMTPTQACQFYVDRVAILKRLQSCSRAREAQSWKIESDFYESARQAHCG
jgi:hypothetical protein